MLSLVGMVSTAVLPPEEELAPEEELDLEEELDPEEVAPEELDRDEVAPEELDREEVAPEELEGPTPLPVEELFPPAPPGGNPESELHAEKRMSVAAHPGLTS